jgi:siderophore synthetase component
MRLVELLHRPSDAYIHMERYVNDGSPSGYSEKWTTSPETSPFGNVPAFNLHKVEQIELHIVNSENTYSLPDFIQHDSLYLHPDTALRLQINDTQKIDTFSVSPTACGRTVQINLAPEHHLKLHYPGIIGRMDRALGLREAHFAITISDYISQHLYSDTNFQKFSILPEWRAVIGSYDHNGRKYEIGMIFRKAEPLRLPRERYVLIPAFSLFSLDRIFPSDVPLLHQLVMSSRSRPTEYLVEQILWPLVDAYFQLVIRCAVHGEFHAQNTLLAINAQDPDDTHIVLRDMESITVDLSLPASARVEGRLNDKVYKCINRETPDYVKKHSFFFDFKLGEYLLRPLIECASAGFAISELELIKAVKRRVVQHLSNLPSDFLPANEWYRYAQVQIDRSTNSRPYIASPDPIFR